MSGEIHNEALTKALEVSEPVVSWLDLLWSSFTKLSPLEQVAWIGGAALPVLGVVFGVRHIFKAKPTQDLPSALTLSQLPFPNDTIAIAAYAALLPEDRERVFAAIDAIRIAQPPKGQTKETVRLAAAEAEGGDLTDILVIAEKSYLEAAVSQGSASRAAEIAALAKAAAARNLGALLIPSNKARAYALFREATELDGSDFWAWIERGRLALSCGDTPEMIASNRKALEVAKRSDDNRQISVAEIAIADHCIATGHVSQALVHYDHANIALQQRAVADAEDLDKQRDLSVSYNKIGDVKVAQGDLPGALAAYQGGLTIREKLAAQDGGNVEWQRDLSVSFNRIGDVKVAQGDLPGALAAYQGGLAIAKKLAAQDGGNVEWQRDLIVSHMKISEAGGDAKTHLEAALEIAEALETKGILAPVDSFIPEMLRGRLAGLD